MKPLNRLLTGGLRTRLVRVFVLQVLAISIATVLGVYAAAWVVERVLVQEALNGEAEYFWDRHADNAEFPLPDTHNLTAFLARGGRPPTAPAWQRGRPARSP